GSSLAKWSATKTSIGSATSAARRESSSSWRKRSVKQGLSPNGDCPDKRLLGQTPAGSVPALVEPGDAPDLGQLGLERAPEAAAVARDVDAVCGRVEHPVR